MDNDLRILLFEITQRCNAHCLHCGSRCEVDGGELLTKDDIINTLKDVKENIGTDVMINISGGEALMRPDLFDIMTDVTALGFDWGLVTNGLLINDKTIEKMKASGMKTVTVSLDGTEKTHEELRGIPEGSFDHIIEALKKLKKANFLDHIQVTFTANNKNVYEIEKLYKIIDKIGITDIRIGFVDNIGRVNEHKDLLLSREQITYLTQFINKVNRSEHTPIAFSCCHYLNDMLNNRKFYCFTGKIAASILWNGDIFVCPNVPRLPELIQGNIRKDKFSDVWKNGFKRWRTEVQPEYCKNCKHWVKCKGDSFHTWDFENNRPKFCYRDIFENSNSYINDLNQRYKNLHIIEVSGDINTNIYIEPEVYEDILSFYHVGKRHPLSMYEQQMVLIGFKTGNDYVIKYVYPSDTKRLYKDLDMFTKNTIKKALREAKIANKNIRYSDDRYHFTGEGLKFLGFIHSHPAQPELQYSIGDEKLHRLLNARFDDYIGILIHPETGNIGAYFGKDIKQANLLILTTKTDS